MLVWSALDNAPAGTPAQASLCSLKNIYGMEKNPGWDNISGFMIIIFGRMVFIYSVIPFWSNGLHTLFRYIHYSNPHCTSDLLNMTLRSWLCGRDCAVATVVLKMMEMKRERDRGPVQSHGSVGSSERDRAVNTVQSQRSFRRWWIWRWRERPWSRAVPRFSTVPTGARSC